MNEDPLLGEVLSDARPVVRQLLAEPLVEAPEPLLEDLARGRARLHGADDADVEVGRAIADRCSEWLDRWGTLDRRGRRLVQVAVRYFALDADGADDLGTVFGFDDDRELVDAVARSLGEPPLEAP